MLITFKAVKGFTGLTNQEVKILSLSVSSFAAFFREEEQRRNTMLKKESLMKTRWISLGLWETAAETKKTESNNCFIIHCFEENNDKHTVVRNLN